VVATTTEAMEAAEAVADTVGVAEAEGVMAAATMIEEDMEEAAVAAVTVAAVVVVVVVSFGIASDCCILARP